MTENATALEELLKRAENYGKSSIELLKLNVIDKSADVVSSLVLRLALFGTVALCLFSINIGLALWLGKILGDAYYGFFITGGFYAIMVLLIFIFRRQWIIYPVSNSLIKQMLKKKMHEN